MTWHDVTDNRAGRRPMDDFSYMSDFPRWSDKRGAASLLGSLPLVGLDTMLGLGLNRVNGREIGFPLGKSAVREGAAPSALEALRIPAEQCEHEEEPYNIGNGHGPSLLQPEASRSSLRHQARNSDAC